MTCLTRSALTWLTACCSRIYVIQHLTGQIWAPDVLPWVSEMKSARANKVGSINSAGTDSKNNRVRKRALPAKAGPQQCFFPKIRWEARNTLTKEEGVEGGVLQSSSQALETCHTQEKGKKRGIIYGCCSEWSRYEDRQQAAAWVMAKGKQLHSDRDHR